MYSPDFSEPSGTEWRDDWSLNDWSLKKKLIFWGIFLAVAILLLLIGILR